MSDLSTRIENLAKSLEGRLKEGYVLDAIGYVDFCEYDLAPEVIGDKLYEDRCNAVRI